MLIVCLGAFFYPPFHPLPFQKLPYKCSYSAFNYVFSQKGENFFSAKQNQVLLCSREDTPPLDS